MGEGGLVLNSRRRSVADMIWEARQAFFIHISMCWFVGGMDVGFFFLTFLLKKIPSRRFFLFLASTAFIGFSN